MQYFEPRPKIKPSDILGKIPAGNGNAQRLGIDDPLKLFFIGILAFAGIGVLTGISALMTYLMK